MHLVIDDDFREICREIRSQLQSSPLSLIESDDEYQRGRFCGGWAESGDHGAAFYFSYYAPDGGDYIFWFTQAEALVVAAGGSIDPELEYWKKSPLGE